MGANRTHSRVEQNHRPTAIRHRAAGSAAFILWLSYKLSHSAKVWTTHFGDQPRIYLHLHSKYERTSCVQTPSWRATVQLTWKFLA